MGLDQYLYAERYVSGCAQDLKDTIVQLDRVLAMPDHFDFVYRSSW